MPPELPRPGSALPALAFAPLSKAGLAWLREHQVQVELAPGAPLSPPQRATTLAWLPDGGSLGLTLSLGEGQLERLVSGVGFWGALGLPDTTGLGHPVATYAGQALTDVRVAWVLESAFVGDSEGAKELRALVRPLQVAELFRTSPDLRCLTDQQCLVMGRFGTFETLQAGETLFSERCGPKALYVLVPGTKVSVSRTRDSGEPAPFTPYELGGCSATGVECVTSRSLRYRSGATVTAGGWVAKISGVRLRLLQFPGIQLATDSFWLPNQLAVNLLELLERWELLPLAVQHMSNSPRITELLGEQPPSALYGVAQAGQVLTWSPGTPPPVALEARQGLLTVLEGELVTVVEPEQVSDDLEVAKSQQVLPTSRHPTGAVVGVQEGREHSSWFASWRARVAATVLLTDLQALGLIHGPETGERTLARLRGRAEEAVVRTRRDRGARERRALTGGLLVALGPGRALERQEALAGLAAQAIAEQFDERVLVVVCLPGEGGAPRPEELPGDRLTRRVLLPIPSEPVEAGKRLAAFLDAQTDDWDPHTVLALVRSEDPLPALQGVLADVVGRTILLDDDARREFPKAQPRLSPYLYTAFLDPTWEPAYLDGHTWPANTQRLRLDLSMIPTDAQASLAALDAADPRAAARIRRWGRGISNRLVGITLSGGGAWGFAHVSALISLHDLGVPVDLVSGTSMGALVGSFYAWGGFEHGTEQVLRLTDPEFADTLMRAVYGNMVTGTSMASMISEELGDVPLAWLELPYYPGVTELVRGSQMPMLGQSLPYAVAASTSWSPLWPAVPADSGVFADGAWTNNLPSELTQLEGVRVLVSSNVILPPWRPWSRPPFKRGSLYNAWQRLGLRGRLFATVRGGLSLYNRQGLVSSGVSPNLYQTQSLGIAPTAFDKGQQMVLDAQSAQAFRDSVVAVERTWRALCRPRP